MEEGGKLYGPQSVLTLLLSKASGDLHAVSNVLFKYIYVFGYSVLNILGI